MDDELREGLKRYLSCAQILKLRKAHVGIAGAGGLGSNAAILLARSGVERFTLVDCDIVESSNLNRQHYWPRHLGKSKTDALIECLLDLNPHIQARGLCLRLDEKNLERVLAGPDIWMEALDDAQAKAMFVEKALLSGRRVISASGICGIGGAPLGKREVGNLTLVGDFQTDLRMAPPMAPRVSQAAAMMADSALEHILKNMD